MRRPLLPSFYIPHGAGPCFWMDWDPPDLFDPLANFLKGLSQKLLSHPKAVLVISAHWEEEEFTLQSTANPHLIYDYKGFPEATYHLTYPAPGAPQLAQEIALGLNESGFKVNTNDQRGYDHGVYVPFKLIYPQANVPLFQLSLKSSLDPKEHLKLGKALAPWREKGLMVVGSGASYHNLGALTDLYERSRLFDRWLHKSLCDAHPFKRPSLLAAWEEAPNARMAHPRAEHLLPLMVASGAAFDEQGHMIYHEKMAKWGYYTSGFGFGSLL